MQSKIRVLSEQTINQIAAGEVIENPASVVKEIVENAIDACSTEITVEITQGGRNLIRITDNGYGMNRDDAVLCLERHATSKIKNVDDIQTIMTMGFRGEAIPSIASISKFSILTCAKDEETGTLVIVDGGKILQCNNAARSHGTTMEIKSLFFNVPVRRKFQKSPNIDTNEILKILSVIALGNPSISFELISNEKKLFSTAISNKQTLLENLKTRIKSILGSDFEESTCPLNLTADGYTITGYIGYPSVTRQNRTGQYLFINQRAVQHFPISYAIRDAYGTALGTNRHPIYVLHLTIPGDLVDVNVHPQKREVRLRQEQSLKELITKSIEQALQHSGFSIKSEDEHHAFTFAQFPASNPQFSLVNRYKAVINEAKDEIQITGRYGNTPDIKRDKWEPKIQLEQSNQPEFFSTPQFYHTVNVLGTIPGFVLIDPNNLKLPVEFEVKKNIVLCLVDQKLATSRIIFDRLCENETKFAEKLLIPYTFETTNLEATSIIEQMDFLNSKGIHIHQSGPKTFIIDAIPDFFENSDIKTLIIDLTDRLKEFEHHNPIQNEKEKQLAICASRFAISDNKRYSLDEAKEMVNQLMKSKTPYSCPKGKSVFAFITKDEIKNLF